MKRPAGDDDERTPVGSRLESFFDTFLKRHPQLLFGVLLVLAIAILIAAIIAKISGHGS